MTRPSVDGLRDWLWLKKCWRHRKNKLEKKVGSESENLQLQVTKVLVVWNDKMCVWYDRGGKCVSKVEEMSRREQRFMEPRGQGIEIVS